MNLIYLALLCGLIATSVVHKSEAKVYVESIVDGKVVTVDQHTYVVSILKNQVHHCGGGILNNRYIISAARCFIDPVNNGFVNAAYIVVAGALYAQNYLEVHRAMREVDKIYIPREFHPYGGKFADIAVIELETNLDLNLFITNVVLPPLGSQFSSYVNQVAVVCGYGHNWVTATDTGSDSYGRRFAKVDIITNIACHRFVPDIRNSQLCGHVRQRSHAHPEGICEGDSGAPLVIRNTIIGVLSNGPPNCREDLEPAIYTRVTSFIPFITYAMNGVHAANMRLARYIVGRRPMKVLVEEFNFMNRHD